MIGALTGGTAGALGAAASTLSAPLISNSLAKAGVDPALSKILTAVGSTALGATAGSAAGGASGSTAGAAGALNEVANNYLSHAEALKREIALQQKQACTTDECRASAQRTINELNQVDTWRDAQLQTACATPSSSLCQGLNSALQIAKDSYTSYDPKSDINSTVVGERSQVNNQSFKYQQRVDNPFAYGVGKGLLKLSPPALVADVGYGAYSLTTAILEHGLESTAINIAKGIADLPGELKARLNSTDPSTRGEALVDVIALGGGAAYLTQKLGLAVVNTADQAITKTTAKIVAKRVDEEALAAAAQKGSGSISPTTAEEVLTSKTERTVFSSALGEPDRLLSDADFAGRGVVRADLADHLMNPEISGKQISGGHSLNNFNIALNDAGGIVLYKVEKGPGIYEIQYQLPNASKPAIKTVYDANIYPYMESMANLAATRALIQYQITGMAEQKIVGGGVEFFVPIKTISGKPPSVPTAYPIGGSK